MIAAGEVIERPVNVVKELVENSLDASASRIDIDLSDGGRKSIDVSDDGTGIIAGDIPRAAENYSTSKIGDIEDLQRTRTLGFRGEALASIRSVSRLTIRSRAAVEETGREMIWRGEEVVSDRPLALNTGTEVIVEDLFFNLPARKKFISSGPAETRRISALVQGMALAYPAVAFSLRSSGRELISLPSTGFAERVELALGADLFEHLRPVEGSSGDISIAGYASLPSHTRGTRAFQHLFVNGRMVRDRTLNHAVRQAYESLIPGDRFPSVVLMIEVPPERLDINVHPGKAEVRFDRERDVHRLVSTAVRESVRSPRTVSFSDKVESVYRAIHAGDEEREGEGDSGPSPSSPAEVAGSGWLFRESPELLFEDGSGSRPPEGGGLFWQLHDSFIMIQIRGGMVVIDQHAAHERVLYDRAIRNIEGEKTAVQSLLFPATLELSPDEYDSFETIAGLLPSIGFEAEGFGPRTILVRGIPAGVRNWEEGRLLRRILADLGSGTPAVDEIVRSFSCRAAVKAGEKLTREEMEDLTDQLFATEFPFTCPHGRPTMLRVDLRDLERRFQRTPGGRPA